MTDYYISTKRWSCLVVIDTKDQITEAAPYIFALRRRWEKEIRQYLPRYPLPMSGSGFLAECRRRYGDTLTIEVLNTVGPKGSS